MSKKQNETQLLISNFVQFLNLESQFPYFKGCKDDNIVADFVGLDRDEYKKALASFEQFSKQAAIEILKDKGVKSLLEELPLKKNDKFLLIGDVVSADKQGWFSIFQHVLEIATPSPRFTFMNVSQQDMLSADAVKHIASWLHINKPTWVFVNLGLNDAQLMPIESEKTMLSLADTWENVSALQSIFDEVVKNPPVWITPVGVIDAFVKESLLFAQDFSEEGIASVRDIISGKPGYVVDPMGIRLGQIPAENPWHYLTDGVHHSISGHSETVKALIKTLATAKEKDGKQLGQHLS